MNIWTWKILTVQAPNEVRDKLLETTVREESLIQWLMLSIIVSCSYVES